LCKEEGESKAYGAGLLSSFGELEFACNVKYPLEECGLNGPPEFKPWDPEVASKQEFPITTYQPVYFVAESLMDAKQKMRRYCEDLPRPFFALHNKQTDTVHIDRPVQRTKGDVPNKKISLSSMNSQDSH
jgi:phenylalanine-4-hydroxylase